MSEIHFDPSPRQLERSDNGWVYCRVCQQPQPVAGHGCATQPTTNVRLRASLDAIREGLDEWAPVGDETLAEAVIRLRHAYEALAAADALRSPSSRALTR